MKFKNIFILLLLVFSCSVFGQVKQNFNLTFFGSSVCNGSNAESKHGYAWQFYYNNTIDTTKYKYFNVSTGGDNTLKIEKFDRLTNKLYPTKPDFVVIGLSLSNEGIRNKVDNNGREQILEQFRSRLLSLADSLNQQGIRPVIVNCYAHSDFTKEEYMFIKKMNRIINTWKYPSINVLGSIDDLEGRWVDGYFADAGHPNTLGHKEMSYAFVPSLFDAMLKEKKTPAFDWSQNYCTLRNDKHIENPLSLEIKNPIHSFTLSFRFKKTDNGSIAGFTSNDLKHKITVKDNKLYYKNLFKVLPDSLNNWTQVVLSHSYANQQTMFFVNGKLIGSINEQLSPTRIHFGGTASLTDLKDLAIHRSSLNADEVLDLYNKKFIQSSLEFYSPMTKAIEGNSVYNHAQSLSELIIDNSVELICKPIPF
jgi:hypothetical protein